MKRKKLILVSLDALSCTDFKYVEKLPHFAKIIQKGAYCDRELSVYPSLTFPSHASIATGCVPGSHGIVHNYVFAPYEKLPRWNFYASNLKRKAIWDYANENGKRVLSMSWPVSAGANMAYSMPEMSPAKPKLWNMANFFRQMDVLRKYGTPGFAVRSLLSSRELPKSWFLGKQPQLDLCMMKSFNRAVRTCDFDIALLHIYGLDDAKHTYGTDTDATKYYLRAYDHFIGQLMNYQKAQKDENITLMFTGDHSQKDVIYAIYGNRILQKMGLADYKNGVLTGYRAYLDSCDGMAYIYVDASDRERVTAQVREAFAELEGVRMVMEPEEFIPLGCDPDAALVLEAEEGYSFESGYDEEAFGTEDGRVISHYKGLHGYLPTDPDYQTMFFCYGEDVADVKIEEMGIIDILPTVCEWLGMKTEMVDGVSRSAVWKKRDDGGK